MGLLKGRWAFVTGASRGIGKELVLGLYKEECNVVLCARKREHCEQVAKLAFEYGVDTICVGADLEDDRDIDRMLHKVDESGITIDILYNVAAVNSNNLDFFSIPISYYDLIYKVNFRAPVLLIQHFLPGMIQRGYGRIVNVGSDAHDEPKAMPYICSKQSLWSLTKEMGYALNGTNIMINLVDPGWCRTDMGTDNALYEACESVNGLLLGAVLEDQISGRYISARNYAGDSISEAITKASVSSRDNHFHRKVISKEDFYNKFKWFIDSDKKRIIFGGGNQAKFYKEIFEYGGCKIDAFMCSNKHDMDSFCGLPIFEMSEFPYKPEEVDIVIAITEASIEGVTSMLKKEGYIIHESYGILYTSSLWFGRDGQEISEVYKVSSNTFTGGKIGG